MESDKQISVWFCWLSHFSFSPFILKNERSKAEKVKCFRFCQMVWDFSSEEYIPVPRNVKSAA